MSDQPKYFWAFQCGFWTMMGCYLFVGGLTHLDFWVALVRNTYYPAAGFISSFVLILLFKKYANLKMLYRWLAVICSCSVMAVVCTAAINPITFMQSGMAFSELGLKEITAGIFNYTLIYNLWGLGYLHIDRSILRVETKNSATANKRLMLEKNNVIVPVNIDDITHVKAAGDYVEVYTRQTSYLNRTTLTSFAHKLDHPDFIQTHRSIIVNLSHVKALSPESKGEYQIILKNNNSVKASRTYAATVRARLAQI